jgi:hypothetical protein
MKWTISLDQDLLCPCLGKTSALRPALPSRLAVSLTEPARPRPYLSDDVVT